MIYLYYMTMKISINSLIHWKYVSVEQSRGLIIFVHGLTSSQEEPIINQWEIYFNGQWYSTFRFNLYGDRDNERKLITNSLTENIKDINDVIDYFVNQWEKNIILIWHSFGWLALLYVDLSLVSKIVLWDASIGWEELLWDVYEDQQWKYIDRWDDYHYYISEQLYKDFSLDSQIHIEQLKSIQIPVIIICAEHGLQEPALIYSKAIWKTPLIVSWADHIFSDNKHKKILFEGTLKSL